jgi:uridine kinase
MEPTVKLILIAGGTASGKTIIADNVALTLKEAGKDVTLVSMDNYYKNYSELGETFETRNNINWDEPSAFR